MTKAGGSQREEPAPEAGVSSGALITKALPWACAAFGAGRLPSGEACAQTLANPANRSGFERT
ncbi:MAG: hypothetical protein QOE54_3187 [Streptosporangiaceae bacterium]|nr:hypothetical protein [Streptosporangiaceae bacterium]MDX6430821.1 hypothetical protein [Streptosporangiaceae bacterium]